MILPDTSEIHLEYPTSGDRLAMGNAQSVRHVAGSAPTGPEWWPAGYTEITTGSSFDGDNLPWQSVDAANHHTVAPIPNVGEEPVASGYPDDGVAGSSTFDPFGRLRSFLSGTPGKSGGEVKVDLSYKPGPEGRPGAGFLDRVTVGGVGGSSTLSETVDEYDLAGNAHQRTTSFGTRTVTDHDEWDRPIREITGLSTDTSRFAEVGAEVQRAYDAAGHLVRERFKQEGVGWVETSYTYTAREQVEDITRSMLDVGGSLQLRTAHLAYDAFGRLSTVTSPGGVLTTYSYDDAGRVESVATGASGPHRQGYDPLGRVVFTTDGDEGLSRTRFDAWGRPCEEELPTGAIVGRHYDQTGETVEERTYSDSTRATRLAESRTERTTFGGVKAVEEVVAAGDGGDTKLVTTSTYDASGRLWEVREGPPGSPGRLKQRYEYEPGTGLLKKVIDGLGNEVEQVYDGSCPWPTEEVVREVPAGGGQPVEVLRTELGYDALGRVVSEESAGTRIDRHFDEVGNLLWTMTGNGDRVEHTYDGRGLVRTTSRPANGFELTTRYDADGRPVAEIVTGESGEEETTSDYDASGRLWHRKRQGSETEVFEYYPDDTLRLQQTRLLSQSGTPLTLLYRYDAANRLVERRVNGSAFGDGERPDGLAALDFGDHFSYDALSRPTGAGRITVDPGEGMATDAQLDPDSRVTFADLDLRGLPGSERVGRWPQGADLRRLYDLYGNTQAEASPEGLVADASLPGVALGHDDLDRPTGAWASDATGAPVPGSQFGAGFEWTGSARPHSVTSHGGLAVREGFTYEGPGSRLSRLKLGASGGEDAVGAFAYSWDAAHDRKWGRQVESAGGLGGLAAGMGWRWEHYDSGRLRHATAGTGQAGEWTFDLGRADELRSISEAGSGPVACGHGTEGRLTHWGAVAYSYDDEGRRTSDDHLALTYDWRGNLVSADVKPDAPEHGGERVTYSYDATGRLVGRTHWSAPGTDGNRSLIEDRELVWDGDTLLAEVGLSFQGEVIWRKQYTPGPDGMDDAPQVLVETGLAGDDPQSALYAFLRDEMGTVIGVAEDSAPASGQPVRLLARYTYTPYGEAHLDAGPELLRVHFDPDVSEVQGQAQAPPLAGQTVGGALLVETTLALDPTSYSAGAGCRGVGRQHLAGRTRRLRLRTGPERTRAPGGHAARRLAQGGALPGHPGARAA